MGHPQGPVRLKNDPQKKQEKREPMPVMEVAKRLAYSVRSGSVTPDNATRTLIARLSYFREGDIPMHSAKLIAAASDLIYSASLRSSKYRDQATEEAERILRDAAMDATIGEKVDV